MRLFQTRRASVRTLAFAAAAAAACSLPGPASAAPETVVKTNLAQALKKTVLLFPFDVPDTVPGAPEIRELLTDTAASRLLASNNYTVTFYHRTLPPVARLRLDQQLTDADVTAPFSEDTVKASKISRMIEQDIAFVGSVDEFQYNETDNVGNMTVSGRLIDAKTGRFIGTPVTLNATSTRGGQGKGPQKALEAARAAGQQLMQKLVPVTNATTVQPVTPTPVRKDQPARKRRDNGLIIGALAILVGLGIGLASSGGGGSGGGGGLDNPPPPP